MGTLVHATAIVHPKAVLGEGTQVGPYSIIGEHVRTGERCLIQEHVVLRGHTDLGKEVQIFPFAVVGAEPQHLGYKGEPTRTVIGDRVILRESTTVHRGTTFGEGLTQIEDDCLIMAYTHVAHDCHIGKNVILANSCQLAGHVIIGAFTTIGGQSAIAQFCRVGRNCYIGGGSILRKDLPPFLLGKGNDFQVQGINAVGLSRQGFTPVMISRLRTLYKIFYLQKLTVSQAVDKILTEIGDKDEVKNFLDFVKTSKLGFIR